MYGGPVVEMDAQGTVLVRSIVRFNPTIVSLSPDGEHFALVGKPLAGSDVRVGVYIGGFHEKEARRLIEVVFADRYEGIEKEPSLDWSPDGLRLLFSHVGTVSLLDVRTGRSTKVAEGGAGRWSPTGDWISFITLNSEPPLLNLSGRYIRLIDPGKQIRSPIEWSPDGKYLLIAEQQGSHVYEGCLWVYRISEGAWAPFPDYGVWLKQWFSWKHKRKLAARCGLFENYCV